jgi:secreted Zn-dependent insulinase-like peptidase
MLTSAFWYRFPLSGTRAVRGICIAVLLITQLAACTQQSVDTSPVQPTFPLTPEKSANDGKAYRYIKLENGLRALLVSDPAAEKAAASLDVYVGSASNPVDRGGLAHFLEHMLFLGTEKYPDSGEYARFISEHGGSRNAYTGFEHTNYFFDIDANYLPDALDRFAQFFISPRFDSQYVEREVNAVEAEYQLGLNTDARRNLDVNREISNPQHPFSILSVGTVDTLADRPTAPVRDDLLEFYRQYYSANLMALAVLGNESLDDLQEMVTRIFSPVPNHDVEIEDIGVPRIQPERLPLLVYIQPKATARSLSIAFAMPDYRDRYRAKPLQYIGNLLGHEGEGSLLSLLKQEGWAEALGAGSAIAYRGGSEFNISISLTEEGLRKREQVLRKVFEYLQLLKNEGPRRTLYEEQGRLAALAFRFRDDVQPIGYVSGLANDMQLFAPDDVLRGNYLMTDYDPDLIQTILKRYFVPGNALIQVIAEGVPVDRESEYYHTPYSVQTIDPSATAWGTVTSDDIDPRLHLPAQNEFVAENVSVLPLSEDAPEVPRLVYESDRMRIWQRQDTRFRMPRGALYTNFRTGFVNATAADAAASELYVDLLSDAVNEFTYPALLAGLNFSISTNSRGIGLNISGYNDKQIVLLERIVAAIQSAELDSHRFDNIRKDLIRALENVKTARASSQVMRQARRLLLSGQYPEAELIAELETLTPDRVAAHAQKLWDSASVDILLNGNYATSAAEQVTEALKPLTRHRLPVAPSPTRLVKLSPGEDLLYRAAVEHSDAVMVWYLQGPDDSERNRAMAGLTGQIISADYFEELRTEQQLGYVVSAFSWPLLDVPGVCMLVQSPGSSVPDVVAASRAFLSTQAESDALTNDRFERHRTALLQEILKPEQNLWEESAYFWREIARNKLDFASREQIAEAVRAVSFSEWQDWYQTYILDRPASLIIAAPGHLDRLPVAETIIDDADAFRASRPFYERP